MVYTDVRLIAREKEITKPEFSGFVLSLSGSPACAPEETVKSRVMGSALCHGYLLVAGDHLQGLSKLCLCTMMDRGELSHP